MLLVSDGNVVPFLPSTVKNVVEFQKLLSDQLTKPFEMQKINALPHENTGWSISGYSSQSSRPVPAQEVFKQWTEKPGDLTLVFIIYPFV